MVRVKIKPLYDDVEPPSYIKVGDAGLSLFSRENKMLQPGERHVFMLGFQLAIPDGHVGLVWDRSSMAAKNGIKSLGGVMDCDFRGEMGVVLINLADQPYEVLKGDKIAQLLIQPVVAAQIQVVQELDETQRGLGGFGSTGR